MSIPDEIDPYQTEHGIEAESLAGGCVIATDPTPILAAPVIADPRDGIAHRRFWLLALLARGVRLGDASQWLGRQRDERWLRKAVGP